MSSPFLSSALTLVPRASSRGEILPLTRDADAYTRLFLRELESKAATLSMTVHFTQRPCYGSRFSFESNDTIATSISQHNIFFSASSVTNPSHYLPCKVQTLHSMGTRGPYDYCVFWSIFITKHLPVRIGLPKLHLRCEGRIYLQVIMKNAFW